MGSNNEQREKIEIQKNGKVFGRAVVVDRDDGKKIFHVVLDTPNYKIGAACGGIVQGHGETIERAVFNAITESKEDAYDYITGIEELQKALFDN